jgi:hypothetical protein
VPTSDGFNRRITKLPPPYTGPPIDGSMQQIVDLFPGGGCASTATASYTDPPAPPCKSGA